MAVTIGIDIGGTKAIAVVTTVATVAGRRVTADRVESDGALNSTVTHRVYRKHEARGPQQVGDLIVELVDECRPAIGADPTAVGLAIAGWLTPDRHTVIVAANLSLANDRVSERVAGRIGMPVMMENDGNAAALAESRIGAAYGSQVSVTLTVGTGVGGGIVVGNRMLTGGRGLAGELGHLCLDPDGPACACGASGCLEAFACGPSILRRAVAAGLPARTAADVVAAARSGDAAANAVIVSAGQALGQGIVRICAVLDPDVVVVGGGVAVGAGDLLLDPIRHAVADHFPLRAVVSPPPITAAVCGPDAGAIGVAALAREAVFGRETAKARGAANTLHADNQTREAANERSHR
jgi:glucokinase